MFDDAAGRRGIGYVGRIHDVQLPRDSPFAYSFWRQIKLCLEGTCKRLVRRIAGIERNREDITGSFGKSVRRLAQTTRPHILHDGDSNPRLEGARQVKL